MTKHRQFGITHWRNMNIDLDGMYPDILHSRFASIQLTLTCMIRAVLLG